MIVLSLLFTLPWELQGFLLDRLYMYSGCELVIGAYRNMPVV